MRALDSLGGSYPSANYGTRESNSRVKPLPEFKIAKLSFVNFEFFIYSNKP
jgi:hypothetical protein